MPSFRVNLQWAAMGEVIKDLYISGVTALRPVELTAMNITMIVNATTEVPNLNIPDIHRVKLWLQDTETEDILSHLQTVTEQMHMVLQSGRCIGSHFII
jgi:hypothetical protein